jgi:cytochrome d ubiquinol oxidase subunit II
MFESLSLLTLQQYWWVIISLLAGILVFLLFVQGGQTLIYTIGKTDVEQTLIVNSLGRKWEFTFTTLVTFGGAFFASFPLFYSTSFGGAYWVWMAILFCFILQAISYEYRSKPNNFLGKKTFEVFLVINGIGGTLLLGTAVATFFTGSAFTVNFNNITNEGATAISRWYSAAHGLEAVLDWRNLALGLAVVFLARVLALLYFMNNINHIAILERSKKQLLHNAIPFVLFFIAFIVSIFFAEGYGYTLDEKLVYVEKFKYFKNFIEMPLVGFLFLIGVLLVLWGIVSSLIKTSKGGIWYSGTGTILTVFALFLIAGFNNTSFYPSKIDFQSSLTIETASSSHYTLTAMSYVSLFIPVVAAYIFYVWRAINKKQINTDELNEEGHIY